jgi:hypothetical protein
MKRDANFWPPLDTHMQLEQISCTVKSRERHSLMRQIKDSFVKYKVGWQLARDDEGPTLGSVVRRVGSNRIYFHLSLLCAYVHT